MTTPVPESFNNDLALWMVTSLTAGSSHIVTATSRLETILRANRVPFKAVDIATNEKARMLWGRRAGKDSSGRVRKLPGLIQDGIVLGDLVEIEEWNEYGELKQNVKIFYDDFTIPSIKDAPKQAEPPKAPNPPQIPPQPAHKVAVMAPPAAPTALPIRSIADEAAQKAKELRLQSLRDKVHGKDKAPGSNDGPKDDDKGLAPTAAGIDATAERAQPPPTSTASTSTASTSTGHVDPPVTSHMGARVVDASQDTIRAIEKENTIAEEPEEDGDGSGSEAESESDSESGSESEAEPESDKKEGATEEGVADTSVGKKEKTPKTKDSTGKDRKKSKKPGKDSEKDKTKKKKKKKSTGKDASKK